MSDPRLKRRIGLIGATVLSFNGAVAASIFALPATLAADFGAFSPLLFPIVAMAALLIIIPFSWSAAAFPESGGPAAYGAVFGRLAGFELGWIYYIARAAAFAANANVLTAYAARWFAGADEGVWRAVILIVGNWLVRGSQHIRSAPVDGSAQRADGAQGRAFVHCRGCGDRAHRPVAGASAGTDADAFRSRVC